LFKVQGSRFKKLVNSWNGISFEEAQTVFYDENSVVFYDDMHFEKEDRFILLGFSNRARMLIVCHVYIEEENIIRIFSARKATKNEKKHYVKE
jgi:uncharacterized protein